MSIPLFSSCFHRTLDPSVGQKTVVRSANFAPAFSQVTRAPWLGGNQIRTLENGDAFFPPMLAAVRSAKHSVTFETFAYVESLITREFSEALAAKAREGIPVHVILDGIGSRGVGKTNLRIMRSAGVQLKIYQPFPQLNPRAANNRTHRKILVVDGKIAFTGGAGHAEAWTGNAHDAKHWRDTQYEVRGPAVAQLQRAFCENWKEATGKELRGTSYFPSLKLVGNTRAQFVYDSPEDHFHPLAHAILMAINSAQKSLILEQSYFVPNQTYRRALLRAARRGVKIEILVPGHYVDSKPTRYASQNHWASYLRAGIRLYQYEATMMHGKLLVADNRLSITGSGNFDDRSFFLNDEVNLHVDSPSFAREQIAMFRRDLLRSREIILQNLPEVLAPRYKRFFSGLIEKQL